MKLLTDTNPKLLKGIKFGYMPFILHLAPANLSGYNVCPGSSPWCRKLCLNQAGRGRFTRTQVARVRKTVWFYNDRDGFMAQLVKDIKAGIRKARKHGLVPCFRLNGTSDIRWENIPVHGYDNVMQMFGDVIFYDYTKLSNRKNIPHNYHLTFSRSEDNETDVQEAFQSGMNVAVVFQYVPTEYKNIPVINGDEHDLRFIDPKGVYVGLTPKGPAKKSAPNGFIVLER